MRQLLGLAAALVVAAPATAADLTKVERRIAKEPAYQTKAPRYCLLVFGPDASPRVWLVLDGDTLYVDRNGNGDLTEKDEKVTAPAFEKQRGDGLIAGERAIEAGKIRTGPKGGHDLMLMQLRIPKDGDFAGGGPEDFEAFRSARGRLVTGVVLTSDAKALTDRKEKGSPPSVQMALIDSQGLLEFSERPETAPVIHFNGPLQMALHPMRKLARGQAWELSVGIGTPGLGKGTFAMRGYQGVPEGAHPVVDLECPPREPKAEPIKLRVTLKQRC